VGKRHIVITIDAGAKRCGRCHKRDCSWCSQFGEPLAFGQHGDFYRCQPCLDADPSTMLRKDRGHEG
jgi:hypothetical protein